MLSLLKNIFKKLLEMTFKWHIYEEKIIDTFI